MRLAAAAAVVLMAATSLAGAGVATPGIAVPNGFTLSARVRLAPDVYRYTIARTRPPQRIQVVRAPRNAPASVRLALSRGRIAGPSPRLARSSVMCRAAGCLAGINGSFFRTASGKPLGAVVMNGEPVQSSRSPKDEILIAPTGAMRTGRLKMPTTLVARYPQRLGVLDATVTVDGLDEERIVRVNGINVYRKQDQTILYTSRYGARTPPTKGGAELLARVVGPAGRLRVDRPTTLEPVRLRWRGATRIPRDGVVLSARGAAADTLVALWRDIRSGKAREQLTLTVGTSPPTWQSFSGRPVLVKGGQVQNPGRDALARSRQPRTIAGWNEQGDLLLVTIDGRRPGARGMTLLEAARFMRRLGAVAALNLDGGGSTTYVERGRVRNVPSEAIVVRKGRVVRTGVVRAGDRVRRRIERPVATAVLLVPAG